MEAARNQGQLDEIDSIAVRIAELRKDAAATLDKIRVLTSPTTIKFMEDDLMRIEQQIEILSEEKAKKEAQRPADLERVLGRARHFVENLEELLIKQIAPIKKARFFAVIFDRTPTYADLQLGNTKTPLFTGVNPFFQLLKDEKSLMVSLPDFESTGRKQSYLLPSKRDGQYYIKAITPTGANTGLILCSPNLNSAAIV